MKSANSIPNNHWARARFFLSSSVTSVEAAYGRLCRGQGAGSREGTLGLVRMRLEASKGANGSRPGGAPWRGSYDERGRDRDLSCQLTRLHVWTFSIIFFWPADDERHDMCLARRHVPLPLPSLGDQDYDHFLCPVQEGHFKPLSDWTSITFYPRR